MIKRILTIAILLPVLLTATNFSVYEANYPNVRDKNINIDEAQLVVKPEGDYIKMGLYLTFSYDFNSWYFKNYNELELEWTFDLPSDAIMHDFWLWEGEDSILVSKVLDKWTAELLFNEVSSPRRNPGLLTQSTPNSNGLVNYNMRLFPIKRNSKKRIKIEYLIPARPSVNSVRAWLPTGQIMSKFANNIDSLRILYYYNTPEKPKIVGSDIIKEKHWTDKKVWDLTIGLNYENFAEIVLPSPVQNDVFLTTFSKNDENFYHLAVTPPPAPAQNSQRNILVVIDFNKLNTSGLDGEYLLTYLKQSILQSLKVKDSINILIAYDSIIQGSDYSVSCTNENIDMIFNKIMKRNFPSYSYFQPLIVKAAEYVNKMNSKSEVLLITNTNELQGVNNPDQYADQIKNMFKADTKIHIVDVDNKSGLYYYYNNSSGYGYYDTQLASFYGRLTYNTSGNLYKLRIYDIKTIFNAFFFEKITHYENVEVQMKFANGYSYSKHFLYSNEGYYPLDFPIMQVGKFSGEFPVNIKVLGKNRTEITEANYTVNKDDAKSGNELISTAWYGEYLKNLASKPYDPITINDIINFSVSEKILTPYSGFLIPKFEEQNNGYCQDCEDETDVPIVDIQEQNESTDSLLSILAYPNPFNSTVNIKFNIPTSDYYQFIIFNILGQKVKEFDISDLANDKQFTVRWNGTNESGEAVSSGIYIATLKSSKIFKSVKLHLLK